MSVHTEYGLLPVLQSLWFKILSALIFFLTWAVCDYLCCRIQDNFTFTIQKIYIHNRWFNTSALSVSLSVKTKFDTVPDSLSTYGLFYAIILCLSKISYLSAFFDDLDYVWEELWFVAQTMHLLHLNQNRNLNYSKRKSTLKFRLIRNLVF